MSERGLSDRINIIQNIEINQSSFNPKKRITSSMYFLDEEPVFSDSEEEMEYSKIVFGQTTTNVSDEVIKKYCDAEVQCKIDYDIENEKNINLIKQCASLDDGEYKEFIEICKRIIAKHSFEEENIDACSCISSVASELKKYNSNIYSASKDYLPSRIGKSFKAKEEIGLISRPSRACGDIESDSTSIFKGVYKRRTLVGDRGIRKSNGIRKRPKNKSLITKDVKRKIKKEHLKDAINESINKLHIKRHPTRKCNTDPKSRKKNTYGPKQMPQFMHIDRQDDLDSDSEKETFLKVQLPTGIVKPLARNWMKAHKSFNFEESVLIKRPEFCSLQCNTKTRRLYSPTQFLLSQECLNSQVPLN